MTKIKKPLYRATVAEYCDLSINVSKVLTQSNLNDSFLTSKADELAVNGESMMKSIATDRKKEKTEELAVSDHKRDAYISSLKLFARAYITWNNGQSAHGSNIFEVIKKHGLGMTDENYQEESALIESLLGDLEKPANKESVEALNLTELVADLRTEQTTFNSLMLESAKLEADKPNSIPATEIKRTVHVLLKQTIDYLNVMSKVNTEQYGSTSLQVAEFVNSLNQKIRTRTNN